MELLSFGLCTTISFTAIAALLLNHLYRREQQVIEERKDLLDRLLAKDFVEYKEMNQEQITYEPISKSDEAEFWEEIEESKM